jgi:hypothetical protein
MVIALKHPEDVIGFVMIPIMDEICRHSVSFVAACLNCDCNFEAKIACYAIEFGRTHSLIGRNTMFCFESYGFDGNLLLNFQGPM